MNRQKYICMYYPDAFIKDPVSLSTFSLFFDEVHLVTFADMARNPTEYLKNIKSGTKIFVAGKDKEDLKHKFQNRVSEFYQFAMNNQPLLGEVLFYHPHIFDRALSSITDKLLNGGLPAEDLFNFLRGNNPDLNTLNEYKKLYPTITDEIILRVAPSSIQLSKENDWILSSDNSEMPVPETVNIKNDVKNLSAILAEECIRLVIPSCNALHPDDILDARNKLEDQLVPFRLMMNKLTADVRTWLDGDISVMNIKNEAKFVAESKVYPTIYDIMDRIEKEKDKLFIKIFGKVLNWIPLVASTYATPTPDKIISMMKNASSDYQDLLSGSYNVSIAKDPGISYLLDISKISSKNT